MRGSCWHREGRTDILDRLEVLDQREDLLKGTRFPDLNWNGRTHEGFVNLEVSVMLDGLTINGCHERGVPMRLIYSITCILGPCPGSCVNPKVFIYYNNKKYIHKRGWLKRPYPWSDRTFSKVHGSFFTNVYWLQIKVSCLIVYEGCQEGRWGPFCNFLRWDLRSVCVSALLS